MKPGFVNNPVGGLQYHLRALFYRKLYWMPFIANLEKWFLTELKEVPLRFRSVMIVGASGGYVLPESWLSQFEEIIHVDIDPLASVIFKKRLVGVAQKFIAIKKDIFALDNFKELLSVYPHSFVLFSNILGQLPFVVENHEQWKRKLVLLLVDRAWASFHDLLSTKDGRPRLLYLAERIESLEAVYGRFFDSNESQKNVEIVDHDTLDMFDGMVNLRHACLLWRFSRDTYHVIEAVNFS